MATMFDKTIWRCSSCGDDHEESDDALYCCPPECIEDVYYRCDECHAKHDSEFEADHCVCDEGALYIANQIRLEAAGQMRMFQ